jgi:microcystin-dependent protein
MSTLRVSSVTDLSSNNLLPLPGTVMFFASSTTPNGWIKCNGASLNTTTYAALFSVIGYSYGGSGAGFNVPDLRGEFIRGWDDSRGVDSGRVFGSSQAHLMVSHQHPTGRTSNGAYIGVTFYSPQPTSGNVYLSNTDQNSRNPYGDTAAWNTHTPGTVAGNGTFFSDSNSGSETRPRNIALLPCIKF